MPAPNTSLPPRHHVERGQLLGDMQRAVQRQQHHAGHQSQLRRDQRDLAEVGNLLDVLERMRAVVRTLGDAGRSPALPRSFAASRSSRRRSCMSSPCGYWPRMIRPNFIRRSSGRCARCEPNPSAITVSSPRGLIRRPALMRPSVDPTPIRGSARSPCRSPSRGLLRSCGRCSLAPDQAPRLAPGAHSTSSPPLPFSTRASTNRWSDSRLR